MKRFALTISGKVQGVFFRASTKRVAEKLELTGFVCNKPDGSVYIEVEGEEEKLDQFSKWCERGPTHALVDQVSMKEETTMGFEKFEVRR